MFSEEVRPKNSQSRQQVKWFAYAAVVLAISATITYVFLETMNVGWLRWVAFLPAILGYVGLPVAVGIAVLKYHLYNIDLIINRTLVYGSLTAVLVLVYFVDIVLFQAHFRALTGEESQLGVVVSTLAIAALFNPLRRRIQGFIDRSFYRRKFGRRVESTWRRLLRHAPERPPAGATRPPPATRRFVGLLPLGRLQASPRILRRDQLGDAGLAHLQGG